MPGPTRKAKRQPPEPIDWTGTLIRMAALAGVIAFWLWLFFTPVRPNGP